MRTHSKKKYLILGIALFSLLSLPLATVEAFRHKVIACVTPFAKKKRVHQKPNEKLETANHLLKLEVTKLRARLEQEMAKSYINRERLHVAQKREELTNLLEIERQIVPAEVIYRDQSSWNSALWVNVGEETNQQLKRAIIGKNSPVVIGRSLVGVVDEVGQYRSRIRLITDTHVKPSVRAVRGYVQNALLKEYIDSVQHHLAVRKDLVFDPTLPEQLKELSHSLDAHGETWYLAKGVIEGGKAPLFRSRNHRLRGVGFNYNFPDDEGPKQDLSPYLIQEGDLLVTTGMDAVFPPGLRVAEVSVVYPLVEGGYAFEVEAIPCVKNLDGLQTVFILPSQL